MLLWLFYRPRRPRRILATIIPAKKAAAKWVTGFRPTKTFPRTAVEDSGERIGLQKLPPEKQNALRERLQKFNSLTPEKRTQALQRMEFLSKLTPQQRQQLRDANQQLLGLPPDRQVAVHKALRHLRQMPPAERQQVIQSDRFRSTFSDQEQKLISQLAEMNPQEGGSAQNPQSK